MCASARFRPKAGSVSVRQVSVEQTGWVRMRCNVVADQAAGQVEVLGFVLELGDLPCTGFVEFECMRLDVPDA